MSYRQGHNPSSHHNKPVKGRERRNLNVTPADLEALADFGHGNRSDGLALAVEGIQRQLYLVKKQGLFSWGIDPDAPLKDLLDTDFGLDRESDRELPAAPIRSAAFDLVGVLLLQFEWERLTEQEREIPLLAKYRSSLGQSIWSSLIRHSS